MHMLRLLHFVAAHYAFTFTAKHIQGVLNTVADAVSRNATGTSTMANSQLCAHSCVVPQECVDLVLATQIDWTSANWRNRFRACLEQASLHPQPNATALAPLDTCTFVSEHV